MNATKPPTLIAAAHGTKNLDGLAELTRLVELVRDALPGVDVELCYVDVVGPTLTETLERVQGPTVIVPLLLATGYHVQVDIPAAASDRTATVTTQQIGPDERISRAVQDRLEQARDGAPAGPVLVLSAGSSDPQAREQLAEVATHLRQWNPAGVTFAQLSDADVLAGLPIDVEIATYLLASGFFFSKLASLRAERPVGGPIADHPLVAEVIVERYHEGTAELQRRRIEPDLSL